MFLASQREKAARTSASTHFRWAALSGAMAIAALLLSIFVERAFEVGVVVFAVLAIGSLVRGINKRQQTDPSV